MSSKLKVKNSKFNSSESFVQSLSGKKGGQATSMADLMKSVKTPFAVPKRGEMVSGIITKLTPQEILMDILAKTEALVIEKDKKMLHMLLSRLHVGQKVEATVINPESDMGNPLVTLRKYMEDLLWKELEEQKKSQKTILATIAEVTKGGLLLDSVLGLSGFLPNSQMVFDSNQKSSVPTLGKKIEVYVLETARANHKLIFSQKPVVTSQDFEKLVKDLKVGHKVSGTVTAITPFGMFVTLDQNKSIDGLIHISEISWEKVENISDLYSVGKNVEALIIGFDKEARRVDLSIKQLSVNPFEETAKNYPVDKKVKGTVSGVHSYGVSVELGQGVEGIIRKEKIPPTVSYNVGDEVTVAVVQVDMAKQQIILVPVLLRKTIGYR